MTYQVVDAKGDNVDCQREAGLRKMEQPQFPAKEVPAFSRQLPAFRGETLRLCVPKSLTEPAREILEFQVLKADS